MTMLGCSLHVLQDQDDGSALLPVAKWLADRDGEKPLGVYGA